MKILQIANRLYGKGLFIIIPFITILLGVLQLVYNNNNQIVIVAVFILSATSAMFAYFYIKENKQNIVYFLVQINNLYYMLFICIATRINISNRVGVIFISFGIFLLFFILQFNYKYKNKC